MTRRKLLLSLRKILEYTHARALARSLPVLLISSGMQMYENAAHNIKLLQGSRCKRACYESEFQRVVTAAVFYLCVCAPMSGKSAT